MLRRDRRVRAWWIAGLIAATACGPQEGHEGAAAGGDPAAVIGTGHYQVENLGRGVVAVKVSNGVYVGWRLLGFEHDPANPSAVSFDVYRDGTRIASVTNSTNYLDTAGTSTSSYTVRAVVNGVAQAPSAAAGVWAQNYLRIPIQPPPGGTIGSPCSDAGTSYTYSANDGSVGDLDGDGEYEIVLKWDPSNAKDNSQSGCTGNVYLDAYRLNGTRLWRIDLGRNIRAGAHYTQFVVYDFDGDGKAEMAVKTAPGTRDGTGAYLRNGPAASDNDSSDYRNASGYVLTGPEYLTVFAGSNGAELATVNFEVGRGTVSSWGDNYGNRVDRFLASAAFVSDAGGGSQGASGRPSILMARGYYTRATVTAWNWRNGQLTRVWTADSNANTAYTGQGAHTMAVADSDGDGAQEIMYGASVIDSNGTRKCSTNLGHGDALHVGAFVPGRGGVQVFMPHEDTTKPSWSVHDGATCQVFQQGPVTGTDTGRGVAGDVFSGSAGGEVWTNNSAGLHSASTGANVGSRPSSANFLVWWDADESRELEDGTSITKYGGGTLLTASGCASNNGTKSTPVLVADLLGDWREEVIWRESNDSALRIYTTTAVTNRRIHTLMHDPQYRMQVSSQQTAYNQPSHPSFAIGSGMAAPPRPDIFAPGQGPTTYTLTIGVDGSGSTNPAPGSYTFAAGTTTTVTATPASGATFTRWSGAATGTSNPVTITMTGNLTLTAVFSTGPTSYTLGVTKAGTGGGTVASSPSGISCGATCSGSFTSGTSVTLTATPEGGSTFGGWSGACTGTGTCIVPMTSARSVTATFEGPTGTAVSINAGGSAAGSFVADGYFSGGSTYSTTRAIDTSLVSGTVPPQAVFQSERYGEFTYTIPGRTPGSAQAVTLYFAESYWSAAGQRTFNVALNGQTVLNAFDISAAGGGADRAVARTFETTANASGQVVIAFTRAGGPDNPKICGIAVADGDDPGSTTYSLTVSKSGTGTVSGSGISCGSTCSGVYASGTTVTLTATPDAGMTFTGWSGAATGTANPVTLTMNGDLTLTAAFSGITSYTLSVTRAGEGSGTVTSSPSGVSCGSTCSASFAGNTSVTLTAAPASGSIFTGWSGACSGTGSCVVSMTAARSVTATFGTSGTTPCANPITFTGQSGNFGITGAVCLRTSATVNGWGCSNFDGRTVSVNGGTPTATCGAGPFPLAKSADGFTYFAITAGAYPWASLYSW